MMGKVSNYEEKKQFVGIIKKKKEKKIKGELQKQKVQMIERVH